MADDYEVLVPTMPLAPLTDLEDCKRAIEQLAPASEPADIIAAIRQVSFAISALHAYRQALREKLTRHALHDE
jgi:hypothetical protein